MERKSLVAGSATAVLVAALVPSAASAPATAAADPNDAGEIIVTAQRVAERLQDVPLAVTAISGDSLRERN
ncbi:MAG: hypothetical protein RQ833_11320, partial [Sphingomonadaceae bacterium]|nr:hypothetical protein [Sphingomonadaceae bacterium]